MIGYVLADAFDVPASDSWLTASERTRCAALRIDKRRADWRGGRWVAKHAVGRTVGLEPALIEIRSAPSGAPQAWYRDGLLPVALSISHSTGRALSAVSMSVTDIGCDLELIESRHHAFVADCFTSSEQRAFEAAGDHRDALITAVWSAKESVLKVLRVGLQRDTRSVVVENDREATGGWRALDAVDAIDDRGFHVWWRRAGPTVMTVAVRVQSAAPALPPPSQL